MGYPDMNSHPHYHGDHERCADRCDDQLPVFSQVGRGLRGDSYKVEIAYDDSDETYLKGIRHDAATNTDIVEWNDYDRHDEHGNPLSPIHNINGGEMLYEYNLRPYTNPQTFTLTLRHKRPHRPEWQWTTPPIPYIWDADEDGVPDVDDVVGSGVATLFFKKTTDSWNTNKDSLNLQTPHTIDAAKSVQEKLIYPPDWSRNMFNAPKPGDPWTVNIEYGIGGDIDAPNIIDLAKILGVSVKNIRWMVVNNPLVSDEPGDPAIKKSIKQYINDEDTGVKNHIHGDIGLSYGSGNTNYANDGGPGSITESNSKWSHNINVNRKTGWTNSPEKSAANTVKGYIDEADDALDLRITDVAGGVTKAQGDVDWLEQVVEAIVDKIPGASININKKTYSLPSGNIAIGNLNVYGGDTFGSKYIKTHTDVDNDDVWAR